MESEQEQPDSNKATDYERPGVVLGDVEPPTTGEPPNNTGGNAPDQPPQPWWNRQWSKEARSAIGLYTLLLTIFSGLQWFVTRGQLIEMESDSKQTKELIQATQDLATAASLQAQRTESLANAAAVQATAALNQVASLTTMASAAQTQAEASGKLAQAAKDQVAKLDAGVTETHALAVAAANSAKAAANQTAISQLQLKNSQRPWVSFSEVIAGPLTFDEGGAKITLNFILRNTGGSAATFVTFEPVFYVSDGTKNSITERAALCDRLLRRGKFEETLFAGDSRRLNWTIPIPRVDVDASAKMFGGMFVSNIVACVVYGSTLSGVPEYFTGTSAILQRTMFSENGSPSVAIRPSGVIKQEDLRLFDDPVSGTIAR
jgi:hypothetical protein